MSRFPVPPQQRIYPFMRRVATKRVRQHARPLFVAGLLAVSHWAEIVHRCTEARLPVGIMVAFRDIVSTSGATYGDLALTIQKCTWLTLAHAAGNWQTNGTILVIVGALCWESVYLSRDAIRLCRYMGRGSGEEGTPVAVAA